MKKDQKKVRAKNAGVTGKHAGGVRCQADETPGDAPVTEPLEASSSAFGMPTLIDEWVGRIHEQIGKSAQSLVALGQMFLDAKAKLSKHGEWEALFAPGKLCFSLRTAQKLMQVAKNTAIAKAPNAALLPPSLDALSVLAQLDADVLQAGIDERVIGPDTTIADAKKFVIDRLEPGTAKTEKPFDYEAVLKALVNRVNRALDKVPANQQAKFLSAFADGISTPPAGELVCLRGDQEAEKPTIAQPVGP